MTKFCAIIPARQGSTRIKNKNLKNINGKPLIYWTIKEAKKSKYLNSIIVSTDSKSIKKFCLKNKVNVPFLRPKKLSNEKSSMHSVLKHAHNYLKNNDQHFDFYVLLQPTSPLRTVEDIDSACKIIDKKNFDSLVSVVKLKKYMSPVLVYTSKNMQTLQSFNKKDKKKSGIFYSRNGAAIYITKVKNVMNYILGGRLGFYLMPSSRSVDIDEQDDFLMAEKLLKN